jgi:mannose-6-phosphate isomerase-like protein (cupin superfamily)
MTAARLKDLNAAREGRADKPAKTNLFETARFFADVWVLRAGQAQAPHHHEREDKLYQVLSGRARVRTGAEEHDVGAGAVVFCPAGEDHAVANPGPEDLRLLVFMAPHPRPPPGPPAPAR